MTYVADDWCRWYVTTSGVAGVVSNQDPVEAHHRVVKATKIQSLTASTQFVLANTLPVVVSYGSQLGVERHFCTAAVPTELIMKADLLKDRKNHRVVYKGGQLVDSVVFNTHDYIVDGINLNGVPVDSVRTKRYFSCLAGKLCGDDALNEIKLKYLSLHRVPVKNHARVTHATTSAVWTTKEVCELCCDIVGGSGIRCPRQIEEVRRKYLCDCKGHMTSGWVCSHVVAAMVLTCELDLTQLLRDAPPRRPNGRPRSVPPALEVDSRPDGFFHPDRLLPQLLKRPACCVG